MPLPEKSKRKKQVICQLIHQADLSIHSINWNLDKRNKEGRSEKRMKKERTKEDKEKRREKRKREKKEIQSQSGSNLNNQMA